MFPDASGVWAVVAKNQKTSSPGMSLLCVGSQRSERAGDAHTPHTHCVSCVALRLRRGADCLVSVLSLRLAPGFTPAFTRLLLHADSAFSPPTANKTLKHG